MNTELVQSYARRILYWLSGALVSHGVIQAGATWVEPTIGVVLTVITFAWSIYGDRLNGLLARVQGSTGVLSTAVSVDSNKVGVAAANAATPSGVTVTSGVAPK